MVNPSSPYPNPGSYDDVLKRMTRRVREKRIDAQIVEILQRVFEKELSEGALVLSRPERARLFQQVAEAILSDALRKTRDTK